MSNDEKGTNNMKNKLHGDIAFSWGMILPAVLFIALLVVYSTVYGIRLSFFEMNLLSGKNKFVGFKNYVTLLTDKEILLVLWNTVYIALLANIISTLVGLTIALLLNSSGKKVGILRTFGYLPWITPSVVYVFTWSWMFSQNFGPFNHFLQWCHIVDEPISFLGDPNLYILGLKAPVFSVLMVRVWSSFPFKMTMFLAALQSIPNELYEAAKIDGASVWHRFMHITIPYITKVVILVFSISTIWNLSHFDVNYLLTKGGPNGITNVLPTYIYHRAFVLFDLGSAATASMIIFLISGCIGFLYIKLSKNSGKVS